MGRSAWTLGAGLMILAGLLFLVGCSEDGAAPSSPGEQPSNWVQSETSMVRASINGHERLILGYNDSTEVVDSAGNYQPAFSFHGLSISDDQGVTWVRRGQLPAGTAEIPAMRGDPWLAAAGPLVLYTGMISPTGGGPVPPVPDGVMLAISRDGADSWGSIRAIHHSDTEGGWRPDGPKVAISADGGIALVTWVELGPNQRRQTWYMIVREMDSPRYEGPYILDERAGLLPPEGPGLVPSCGDGATDAEAVNLGHPVPAIGASGDLYVARVVNYRYPESGLCTFSHRESLTEEHLELFRSLDRGQSWKRIHSANLGSERPLGMLGVNEDTQVGMRPSLVITEDEESSEIALLAREVHESTSGSPVGTAQHIELRRLPHADVCATSGRLGEGCAGMALSRIHQIVYLDEGGNIPAIPGDYGYGYQPALFVGGHGSLYDPRVGLFFYMQPYAGDPRPPSMGGPTEIERRYTTVVGFISTDGGASWGKVGYDLLAPVAGRAAVDTDTFTGRYPIVFQPCPKDGGYFGHYNGGAFYSHDPAQPYAVASWADSREGCTFQVGWRTQHQEVFSSRFPRR